MLNKEKDCFQGENKTKILLTIFEQNWLHIRHIENERLLCLNAYVAIIAASFHILTKGNADNKVLIIALLLIFSLINLLLSLKMEAVIENYVSKNERIAKNLEIKEFTGLRVKSGIWKVIRLKYLFPIFYGVMLIIFTYFLIRNF